MKIERKTIETLFEGEELEIQGVRIADEDYNVKINNQCQRLSLTFNQKDYRIVICSKGIRFERLLIQHETKFQRGTVEQSLYVKTKDSSKSIGEKGDLVWLSDRPYNHGYSDFEIFYLSFDTASSSGSKRIVKRE